MDNDFSIRSAADADRDELISLKLDIMHSRYQGYLPEKNLEKLDKTYIAGIVDQWMKNQTYRVGILTSGKEAQGYIVCAPDPELQGWGLIIDAGARQSVSCEGTGQMFHWANEILDGKGCRKTHIWLLQDNLRARFMIESFGYKPQKEMKLIQVADYTMTERRYVFP